MSEAQDTDLLLVNRNGTSYKQEIETMRDRIDDTDLLVVYRNGQAYKITGEDFIDSTQSFESPVITNAVLSEDSPGGTRFANQEFDVTYNMSNNGVPDSSKLVKPYVIGGISLFGETSAITNVASGVWAAASAPEANGWYSVTYGDGKFVSVCGSGTNRVMYSTDGSSWSSASSTAATGWNSVTYGNSKFVAVSSAGTNRVMYSTDGINWSAASAAAQNNWRSVTYGDGKFVAVSIAGTNGVMYSTDGINWTAANAPEANNWNSVVYGNGKYVAVAYTGTNRVMYSSDAINWTSASATSADGWYAVTYGDGKFVALSYDGTNQVMYSTDGINWTAATSAETNNWREVTYADGKFLAVATSGTNRVMWSPDGINWNSVAAAEANNWYGVTYGGGKFVAVATSGTNRVMSSGTGTGIPTLTLTNNQELGYFEVGDMVQSYWNQDEVWSDNYICTSGAFHATKPTTLSFNSVIDSWSDAAEMTTPSVATFTQTGLTPNAAVVVYTSEYNGSSGGGGNALSNDCYVEINGTKYVGASGANGGEQNERTGTVDATGNLTITNTSVVGSSSPGWNYVHIKGISVGGKILVDTGVSGAPGAEVTEISPSVPSMGVDGGTWAVGDTVTNTVERQEQVTLSTDDITAIEDGSWNVVNLPNTQTWQNVSYGNGKYIAVAYSGTKRVMHSTDAINWTLADAADNSNDWSGIVYGNGKWVSTAVTGTNRAMHSTDGITWTAATAAPPTSRWVDVAYGDGKFVAISLKNSGTGTTNQVMYSTDDGDTWTGANSVEDNNWYSITYGNGTFVAVAYDGTNRVMYSTDAINWTGVSVTASDWGGVAYGNGKFVAVAWSGTNRAMYSTDGISWTNATAEPQSWMSVVYSDGLFVALSSDGTNKVMYSADGINWNLAIAPEAGSWYQLTGGGGKFVAMANTGGKSMWSVTGTGGPKLTFATDLQLDHFQAGWALKQDAPVTPETSAITNVGAGGWTGEAATEANNWQAITYGDGKFVAVSSNGTNRVMYSTDGSSWTAATAAEANHWVGVTYGDSKFVAVARTGTNRVMYSTDAINWTAASASDANSWRAVTYGNGKFVAVSNNGNSRVMYSSDGINWTSASDSGTQANTWFGVTYGGGKFVAVGSAAGQKTMYSTDGINWTAGTLPGNQYWNSVTYGDGKYVAVCNPSGNNDQVAYSTDAINWNSAQETEPYEWKGITYGSGKFVAVGEPAGVTSNKDRIMWSTDGITWNKIYAPDANSYWSVTYGGGKFVALSNDSTDTDMVMWSNTGNDNTQLTFTDDTQFNNFQVGDMVSDWNQDQVWSDNITGTVYSGASYAKEKVFDGDLTTYSLPSDGNTLTWTPSTPISATSVTLHVFSNSTQASKIQVNGSDANTFTSGTNTYGDITVALSGGQLQTVSWSRTDAYNTIYIYGISIGGKELVDTGIPGDIEVASVTPASNQMEVDGGTWTNGDTATGPVIDGTGSVISTDPSAKTMNIQQKMYSELLLDSTGAIATDAAKAFDGVATSSSLASGSSPVTWTKSISNVTALRVFAYLGGAYGVKVNGNAVTGLGGAGSYQWVDVTSGLQGSTTLESISWYITPSSTTSSYIGAVEVNGVILTDTPITRFAIGSEVETSDKVPDPEVKMFCVTNALGSISDLSITDPGYTAMANTNTVQTLTFPGTFPSGVAADTELPVGTTLAVDVKASNMIGTVTATTNVVTPTT